jgi:hypothetical protein
MKEVVMESGGGVSQGRWPFLVLNQKEKEEGEVDEGEEKKEGGDTKQFKTKH